MRCQSWVDPQKFNKKNQPTPRSLLGTFALDPLSPDALRHYKEGTRTYEKQEAALNRAVRCGGCVEFWMSVDYDEGGATGSIDTELQCKQCGENVHEIRMSEEVVTQWIQERLDRGGTINEN